MLQEAEEEEFMLSSSDTQHILQGKETGGHSHNSFACFCPSHHGSGSWRDGSAGKVLAMQVPGPESDHQCIHENTGTVLPVMPVLGIRDRWTPKTAGQSDLIKEPQVPV